MGESRDIALLLQARTALAEAKTLGEVKAIRDHGHAAIKWARSRRDLGLEAQNNAAEIVLLAERRLGRDIATMQASGELADRGGDRKSKSHDDTLKLSDYDITKSQSSRWQAEARVSEDEFLGFIASTRDADKQLTSGALVKLGRQQTSDTLPPTEPIEGIFTDLWDVAAAGHEFGCIYADPPWQYGNQATRASTDNHYQTMDVDTICKEPVETVAADDCHLHLWTTNAFLFDAKRVMEAWGFEYRSCLVWVKPQMGLGNYWRVSHEFLLLGIRGNAKRFEVHNEMSWAQYDRTKHSRKPRQIREKLERVSRGPYLEMYGREVINGWTVYGNQVEKGLFNGQL